MSTSATALRFDDITMWVPLTTGRAIGMPLASFPCLPHPTPEQWADCRIGATGAGLRWEDEDSNVEGLLAGRGDMGANRRFAA
jgi:hypothetical protein